MADSSRSGLISVVPRSADASGPAWLASLRARATETLHANGFPGKRDEAWRFTSVREVVDTAFENASSDDDPRPYVQQRLGDDGTWRVVLAEGRPWLDGGAPDGVSVQSLKSALADPDAASQLEPLLGSAVESEHFAALNGALFTDGVVVTVSKNADVATPIHLVHVATPRERPAAAYPRVVVRAEAGSRATLVESYISRDGAGDAKHLMTAVTEVSVAANAEVDHIRITEGSPRALQLAYLGVRLDRDARYASRVVALGGALTRLELGVRFEGPGAEARLDGAYHAAEGEHVDHQLRVEHAAGRCASHVRYRGLLDGHGHAVFNAVGVVARDAAGSEVHQDNRNLLLSDHARIDTKPHLEIDCDDVSASHGTTVGALSDDHLFYLRSRGIPETRARDILTFAFVRAILVDLKPAAVVARTTDAVLARLPHGDALREDLEA